MVPFFSLLIRKIAIQGAEEMRLQNSARPMRCEPGGGPPRWLGAEKKSYFREKAEGGMKKGERTGRGTFTKKSSKKALTRSGCTSATAVAGKEQKISFEGKGED